MTIDDPHTTRRPTDAFTGALLTLACGDALGAPAEFTRQPAMRQKFGELRDMFGGGSCGWAPGEDGKLVRSMMSTVIRPWAVYWCSPGR